MFLSATAMCLQESLKWCFILPLYHPLCEALRHLSLSLSSFHASMRCMSLTPPCPSCFLGHFMASTSSLLGISLDHPSLQPVPGTAPRLPLIFILLDNFMILQMTSDTKVRLEALHLMQAVTPTGNVSSVSYSARNFCGVALSL